MFPAITRFFNQFYIFVVHLSQNMKLERMYTSEEWSQSRYNKNNDDINVVALVLMITFGGKPMRCWEY